MGSMMASMGGSAAGGAASSGAASAAGGAAASSGGMGMLNALGQGLIAGGTGDATKSPAVNAMLTQNKNQDSNNSESMSNALMLQALQNLRR